MLADLSPAVEDCVGFTGHRPHHEDVLVPLDASHTPGCCDAVVVPSSRGTGTPRNGFALAARVAASHGCPLLVLISKDACSARSIQEVEEMVAEESRGQVEPRFVNITAAARRGLGFQTDQIDLRGHSDDEPRTDLALKRNLALLAARFRRGRHVLFLDDDLQSFPRGAPEAEAGMDEHRVALAVGALRARRHDVVGWNAVGFEDNSVVCRLRRWAWGDDAQGVFIGGGAMLVRVSRGLPFFPDVYDEDWQFLVPLLLRGPGRVAKGGVLLQDLPQSAVSVSRARVEEIADALAEGLMNLAAHRDAYRTLSIQKEHWARVLADRLAMVVRLTKALEERAEARAPEPYARALDALNAVAQLHADVSSDIDGWAIRLVDFIRAYREDLRLWRRLMVWPSLSALPRPVADAVVSIATVMAPPLRSRAGSVAGASAASSAEVLHLPMP